MLLDLAAEKGKFERKTLEVAKGSVSHPASKVAYTFGELTKGMKLTKAIRADAAGTPTSQWKVAGTSVPKADGGDFVTGGHQIAPPTLRLPGMLFGKVLRPEALNATLVSVDLKQAEAIPGVTVVHDDKFIGDTRHQRKHWPSGPSPPSRPSGSRPRRSPTRICSIT